MSTDSTTSNLLTSRRFLPLFITQALGALNDNLFKNALLVLIIFRIGDVAGMAAEQLVTIAAGVFILPFFLFSSLAGQLADKYDKSRLVRWGKVAEIGIMGLAAYGFWLGDAVLLISTLFLMGTQSAFFSPAKYGLLPQHLKASELVRGNGLFEAGSFLAILIGTIAGSLLILRDDGTVTVSVILLALAIIGTVSAFAVPRATPAAPDLKINVNLIGETRRVVTQAFGTRAVKLAILGISWFLMIGATYLTQFPAFAKETLLADESVVTLFLTLFSIGIAVGSVLCNRLLKSEISAKYVPLGTIGMTIFMADFYLGSGLIKSTI